MFFIVLNCAFKLSLWKMWQRFVFSGTLALFAYVSVDYAMLQSKTQIADYLQNNVVLQDIAIIVTIESAVCLAFCFSYFKIDQSKRMRYLHYYPSLLLFPVIFYLLTQSLFTLTGVDFETTALVFAIAIVTLLPLIAEGAKWLIPEETGRVEIHLLLTIFVCLLGLIATENGKMLYAASTRPIHWVDLALTFLVFSSFISIGIILSKFKKWK